MNECLHQLSDPQYNIWLEEQNNPESFLNVMHTAVTIYSRVDELLLNRAVNETVRRNDALRLRVTVDEDGQPAQYAEDYKPFYCEILDFSGSFEKAQHWLKEESHRGFLLKENPLCKFVILRLPEGQSVLSARIHHIACDGYHFGLMFTRIFYWYQKFSDGFTAKKGDDPSYFEFADSENNYAVERQIEDTDFWKEYLRDLPAAVQIRPVQVYQKSNPARLCLPVGLELTTRLRRFSEQNGVSTFHVMLSSFLVYLARCCQTEDLCVVVPRLNRDTERDRHTLGEFTVAVPVRVKIEKEWNFLELCRRVKESSSLAAAHKKYGYSSVLEDLHRGGYAGIPSNFTFSFQQTEFQCPLQAEITRMTIPVLGNHLTMTVGKWNGDGFTIFYDYLADVYSEQEIQRIHEIYCHIMLQAVAAPGISALELSILPQQQEDRLLHTLNNTRLAYDKGETIVSLFQKQAEKNGARTAVICSDGELTFEQLDRLSNRIARAIQKRGVGKEDLVAFMLPRTSMMIACMFGILKAGGAFVPIDHQYPAKRIGYVLENSSAKLLISVPELAGAMGVNYITAEDLLSELDDSPVRAEIKPNQLAYCIYTSGTTGKPKGVLVEHHGINNFTYPGNNPFNRDICTCGRGIVAIGSICFDISFFELFVTLLNGMYVVLAAEDQLADPEAIAELICSHGVNLMHCTPSRLLSYLNEPKFQEAVKQLDVVLSAGEALPAALVPTIHHYNPNTRVYNGYGPTETTIGATIGLPNDTVSIGTPVANVQIYIQDAQGRLLPEGCAGEICIGGDGVGRGYLNLPELTSRCFTEFRGGHIYHTGDLGYWNGDGRIMFLGRNDDQVKLRGLRIELPEIENCLGTYPGILQQAALVWKRKGSQNLCCFFTASRKIEPQELKQHLRQYLSAYMVPEFLVQLDQMPMTPNKKTDKKALENYPVEITSQYEFPKTDAERRLCRVFAKVLQLEEVGAEDNFFEMGGTSLLAAKVMLLARKENILFTYSDIFACQTVRKLANLVGQKKKPEQKANLLEEYDYAKIDQVLKYNSVFTPGKGRPLGTILLTGATGYLGIHLLHELLIQPDYQGRIYCLVRRKEGDSSKDRLKSMLFYYFEDSYVSLFESRITVLQGDITQPGLFEIGQNIPKIDTVINCAADVAYFAYNDKLQRVNVQGVQNLLDFSRSQGCALMHISTMSVGGSCTREQYGNGMCLSEERLFLGQRISNEYILTKFLAERLILQAAAQGLPVKIMRIGNLQGRYSDGEFQINLQGNAFTKTLQSYVLIGKAPESMREAKVQFSPVDCTVQAIVKLLATPLQYTVFHTYNPNDVPFDRIFSVLGKVGCPVQYVPDEEFHAEVDRISRTEKGHRAVGNFLLEKADSTLLETPISNRFTDAALKSSGFSWGLIGIEYLEKYISALQTLGFFDL